MVSVAFSPENQLNRLKYFLTVFPDLFCSVFDLFWKQIIAKNIIMMRSGADHAL
jgi:hypothetical protein